MNLPNKIEWLTTGQVFAIHEKQIATHGGSGGVRDWGILESALDRPKNLLAYGNPTILDLGAAYAFGIVKNHPFVDGNKRTAFVAAYTFLGLHGYWIKASQSEIVNCVTALAASEITQASFSEWLHHHT